jgi:hypothetical protein
LPEDRRVTVLSLTPQGKYVATVIDQQMKDYFKYIFSNMTEFEQDMVIRSITLLNESMAKSKMCYTPLGWSHPISFYKTLVNCKQVEVCIVEIVKNFLSIALELTILFILISFLISLVQDFIPYEKMQKVLSGRNALYGAFAALLLAFVTRGWFLLFFLGRLVDRYGRRIMLTTWTLSEAVRTRAFWFVMICGAIPAMIDTGITLHIFPTLSQQGIDRMAWGIAQGFMNIPLGLIWPFFSFSATMAPVRFGSLYDPFFNRMKIRIKINNRPFGRRWGAKVLWNTRALHVNVHLVLPHHSL